jgi:hypothetical protein
MKIKILFPNTVKPTTSNIKISLRETIPKLKETPNLQTSKAFSVKPFSNPKKSTLSNIKPTPSNIKPCFHERELRSSMEESFGSRASMEEKALWEYNFNEGESLGKERASVAIIYLK